jgi:diguanylate cyclase (GGDEF)-like protein
MVGEEGRVGEAVAANAAADRDQRRRKRWTAYSAASYAADTLFLALFGAAGTIPWAVAPVYGLLAAAICSGQYVVYARGWNLRFRDPNLTAPFLLVAAAPAIAFPYLSNLFTVFAFGMIWLDPRSSALLWSVGAAATGLVLYAGGSRLAVPVATPLELALVWLYFSLVLGRCVLISLYASELRSRLERSRRALAATLAQVEQLATHDELTLVLNRRSLMSHLEQERGRAERSGVPFSIALMDLDHFKAINDAFGHAAGDEALKKFADIVRATMRATDIFGRYGGEEFMMILTGTTAETARLAMERVRAAVAAGTWPAPGKGLTVSIGVAEFRRGEKLAQLLGRADMALYEAKRAGRDRVVVGQGEP